jgi:hypothetical protein
MKRTSTFFCCSFLLCFFQALGPIHTKTIVWTGNKNLLGCFRDNNAWEILAR